MEIILHLSTSDSFKFQNHSVVLEWMLFIFELKFSYWGADGEQTWCSVVECWSFSIQITASHCHIEFSMLFWYSMLYFPTLDFPKLFGHLINQSADLFSYCYWYYDVHVELFVVNHEVVSPELAFSVSDYHRLPGVLSYTSSREAAAV